MQAYKTYQPTGFDAKGLNADIAGIGEYLVVLGRNRDSSLLAQSNWDEALRLLGGESDNEDGSGPVQVHRFGHWACGWFELLLVAPDSPQADIAQEIQDRLEQYPILDEDNYSKRQMEAAWEYWQRASLRERVEMCQEARVSVFAARRKDEMPEEVECRLMDSVEFQ